LSFDDAPTVFSGPCVSFADERFDYGERGFITLGQLEGRVVVIAHSPRRGRTRVISMRRANTREQNAYFERLETS